MQEVLVRFPYLGDKIFQNLNSHSLIRCKEVSRTWDNFMKIKKSPYLRVIKWYTNYSECLIKKIVEKFGAEIVVMSILREIFGCNRPLLICCHTRLGQRTAGWSYHMNHTTKSTQLEDLISQGPLPYGQSWGTTTEGTVYCCNIIEQNETKEDIVEQFIKWNAPPIYQSQQPKIPHFVQNQGQWELTWKNLTGKHYQKLLQFQRQKWNLAISENFPKCNTGLLLSLFCLELPQEEEEVILDPNVSLLHYLGARGVEISEYKPALISFTQANPGVPVLVGGHNPMAPPAPQGTNGLPH